MVVELVGVHGSSGPNTSVRLVLPESLARARRRLDEAGRGADTAALDTALERAREALESFAEQTAGLETTVPDRLDAAIRDGMRAEAAPVARSLAEVRGLSNQTIRRLEHIQTDIEAERRARIEDLALLVDLVAAGWQGVDRRLDRLERSLDRLERSLEDAPGRRALPARRPARAQDLLGHGQSVSSKREPRPGSETSDSSPPSASASSRAIARPRPVPCEPSPEMNGRKMRSCSSGATPGPLSETVTETAPFAAVSPSPIRPPSGVQTNALSTRFVTIWRTRSPSVKSTGSASKSRSYVIPRAWASSVRAL